MSKLKRIRTRINKENLEKALKEGHITEELALEVIDTNGLYNPYTDTYINPDVLPEISVTAEAPERTWTSEWTYNDPEFRLAREHRNIAALEVAKSTRDKMNQVGNAIGKTIIGGTSFTPLWFAAPIAKAGIAASEGDYSGAAKEAAVGLLAPYAIGKGLLKGYRAYLIYKGWQNGLKEGVAHTFFESMLPVRTTSAITHTPTDRVYSLSDQSQKLIAFELELKSGLRPFAGESEQNVYSITSDPDYVYKLPKGLRGDDFHDNVVEKARKISTMPYELGAETDIIGYIKRPTGLKAVIRQKRANDWDSAEDFDKAIELLRSRGFDYNRELRILFYPDGVHGVEDIVPSNTGKINGKLVVFDPGAFFKNGGKLNYLNYIK